VDARIGWHKKTRTPRSVGAGRKGNLVPVANIWVVLFSVTKIEKRILSVVALLIILGLIGMAWN